MGSQIEGGKHVPQSSSKEKDQHVSISPSEMLRTRIGQLNELKEGTTCWQSTHKKTLSTKLDGYILPANKQNIKTRSDEEKWYAVN